ncbi:MAG: hypothetical protein RL728_407 [Bacteroidota bacterium]|jgi:hypothetical protein
MKIVNIAMSLVSITLCVVLFYFIAFTNVFSDRLDGFKKPMMIAILSVYAVYRAFMLYLTFKNAKHKNT